MQFEKEEGQSIILVALAMSIFLLGAVGLGFDGSQLYEQRNLAQNAADAAAIAGVMSIFDGTTGAGGTANFTPTSGGSFTCGTSSTASPCLYAGKNGFTTASDTVTVSFPTSATGVTTSSVYPIALVKVDITRTVPTTLMHLIGLASTPVKATATAAIVDVTSPVPIIVTHPTMDGSFSTNGNTTIQICGGPSRSIQVNSSSKNSTSTAGNSNIVDLSKAGPLDTFGTCAGTGASFGDWGGPSSPTFNGSFGVGQYVQPASPIPDPLASVPVPPVPGVNGTQTTVAGGATGAAGTPAAGFACPTSTKPQGCTVLTPGLYATGISLSNTFAYFKPGIYYMKGSKGFSCGSNCSMLMLPGTADGTCTTCTNTGWDGTATGGGMLVHNTGTGQFDVGSNGSVSLIGAPTTCTSPCTDYKGILFFEDRSAAPNNSNQKPKNPHKLGGGGALQLIGTIYLNNTTMTSSNYQELDLQGNAGNATNIQGEIIVSALSLGGGGTITMNINSTSSYIVSQVALVN